MPLKSIVWGGILNRPNTRERQENGTGLKSVQQDEKMNDKINTYIKLSRKMLSWRWYQDSNTKAVFLDLLIRANIEPHDFERTTIGRGEIATSYSTLAGNLGLTYMQVRWCINKLIETEEIEVRRHSKYLVIKILNYNKYQDKPLPQQQSLNNHTGVGKADKKAKSHLNSNNHLTITEKPETSQKQVKTNSNDPKSPDIESAEEVDKTKHNNHLTISYQSLNNHLTTIKEVKEDKEYIKEINKEKIDSADMPLNGAIVNNHEEGTVWVKGSPEYERWRNQ